MYTHTFSLTHSHIYSSPPSPSPDTHTQWLQFLYFFLGFFTDIMPRSRAKFWFQKLCDLVFTTVVFPFAIVSGLCASVWISPTRRNALVNQVEFLGLAGALATM